MPPIIQNDQSDFLAVLLILFEIVFGERKIPVWEIDFREKRESSFLDLQAVCN
jgi:hypothetical protein